MMDEAAREKIQTEPLTFGDLFVYSHRYFSNEMAIVLGISLVFALPSCVLWYALSASVDLFLLLAFLFIWIIGGLVIPLFLTWMTSMMQQTADMGQASSAIAWRMAWKRYLPLAWALCLQGLIVLAWLMPFIIGAFSFAILYAISGVNIIEHPGKLLVLLPLVIPAVVWQVYYTFVIYIASVLPMEGMAVLNYSKELVKGRWFEVFGLFLLFTLASELLPWIIAPHNIILRTLTTSCFELITPYSLFPFCIWFLNLHYLRERTAASTASAE